MEAKPWRDAVKEARESKGLEIAELARLIGVDPKTIERWENGITGMPQGANRRKALYVLGLKLVYVARPATERELADQWIELTDDERELIDLQKRVAALQVRARRKSSRRTPPPSADGGHESSEDPREDGGPPPPEKR